MVQKYLDLTGLTHFWEKAQAHLTANYAAKSHTHTASEITDLSTSLNGKVDKTTTVNGQPLSSNVTLTGENITVGGSDTHAGSKVSYSIEDLYKQLGSLADSTVMAIDGKTGEITTKKGSSTNGDINLQVSEDNELSATIVGLKSAAYTESSAYATAAQGAKADSALQTGSATGDTYLTLKATKSGTALSITGSIKTANVSDNGAGLAVASDVKSYVDSKIAAADAMIYKGTIGATGATITTLPTTYNVGWTYKVATAGTYAGVKCEIGDMIIALVNRTGTGNTNSDWTVIQANIDGAVTGPASATSDNLVAFSGATGKVVADSGISKTSVSSTISDTAELKSWRSGMQDKVVDVGSFTPNETSVDLKIDFISPKTGATQNSTFNLLAATTSAAGVMTAADKTKLNGLSNYVLPEAGASLGGVKSGGVATISGGLITAISKASSADTATTATTATKVANALTIKGLTEEGELDAGITFNGSAAQSLEAITFAEIDKLLV